MSRWWLNSTPVAPQAACQGAAAARGMAVRETWMTKLHGVGEGDRAGRSAPGRAAACNAGGTMSLAMWGGQEAEWQLLESGDPPPTTMPRGDKSSYTDKQKRQAAHIEESYRDRGVTKDEAEARAWATVNKTTGGGRKSRESKSKKNA
jgi:hypothetical protein